MEGEVKTLATVSISDETTPEEKEAIKRILLEAGMIVANHGKTILVQAANRW